MLEALLWGGTMENGALGGAHHIQVTKPTLMHQFETDALDPDQLFILTS